MHQFKELIEDINIEYKEMPEKLECLIVDKNLYINTKLSSNTDFRKSYSQVRLLCKMLYNVLPFLLIKIDVFS